MGILFVATDVECVGRGSHADHRPAGLEVGVDVRHLFVGQIAEAGADEHQVGVCQRLEAGDVAAVVGIDDAALRIDREHHAAVEAVMTREDAGKHWHCLLGAVLLVAGDQDDFFALAEAFFAFVIQPLLGRCGGAYRRSDKYGNQ